ncbi:hypothetical protein WA538_001665, partial [Blastocystis sp. DL]
MVVQKMQSVLESLEDAAIFEMLPYIFHCFDMEDPTLTEQTFRLLNVIVQKTCSTLLVNSIYTSLHTLFSANGYLTQKQFPLLIPSLYRRLSASVSPAEQFNENCLAELRSIYFRLCEDTRLVIRRQASRQFFACFSAFGAAYRPTFLSHLHVFLHDDESIQIAVLPFVAPFLSADSEVLVADYRETLLSHSPRTQEAAIHQLQSIGESMSIDSFRSSLLDVVLSLTREGCLPIRVMAIRRLLW